MPGRVRRVPLLLGLADVEAEEHRRDEHGREAAPRPSEGVAPEVRVAAVGLEGVAGLDEDDAVDR